MFLRAAALGVLMLLAAPMVAGATESICPGGSSPRSDITWCADFDNLANCTTGQESQCWQDNHYSGTGSGWGGNTEDSDTIVNGGTGGGAVGNGYVRCRPLPGETGCAPVVVEPVPGFTPHTNAMNFRYYLRYRNGFLSFDGGHNVQMMATSTTHGSGCYSALKFQHSGGINGNTYYPYGSSGGTCDESGGIRVDAINLPQNMGTWTPLKNDRWYLVEVQGIMDTACTDVTSAHGCNGQVRVWIDGTKITEYTDLNMGGYTNQLQWGAQLFAPESYYHYGAPPWRSEIDWDNFAVSNNGTYIGPAENENARGTADAASPYANTIAYGAWLGRHAASDCTGNTAGGENGVGAYRSGLTLDPGQTHGTFINRCSGTIAWRNAQLASRPVGTLFTVTDGTTASDCTTGGGANQHNCVWTGAAWEVTGATDNSLKVNLTNASDGGGGYKERYDAATFPQWASYGWIYLPSTNTYTVTNLALSGFTSSITNPAYGYVALSVSGGKWSVDQKTDGDVHGALVSNTSVTYDTWHEYELILWNTGAHGCASANRCVSLMIDRTRIYNTQALPQSAAWAFQVYPENPVPKAIVGVIDFQGTPPFVAYFDDSVVTTASAWNCEGWGSSCPFDPGRSRLSRGVALGRGVKVQ